MDCEKFDSVTMELLYGELDELSEAAALRHLHHCTRCRDIWGHLRTTREIAEIPLEEPPEDLFESVLSAEATAQKTLPARERVSRAISVLAGYAMRPQLAMAALLLLMIGSSLVFVRTDPSGHGQVSVTELGTPDGEPSQTRDGRQEALVFDGERQALNRGASKGNDPNGAAAMNEAPGDGNSNVDAAANGRTYNEAMAAYQEGRYAEAERLFSEVASSGDERAASAALHEGHAARNGSGCQRAAALYDSVAARYTGGTVANEASWHAATCYRAMGQLKRASAHYEKLQDRPAYTSRATKALEEINAQLVAMKQENAEPKEEKPAAIASSKVATKPEQKASAEPSSQPEDEPTAPAAPPVTQQNSKKSAPIVDSLK